MFPQSPADADNSTDSPTAIAQLARSLAELATPPPDDDDLLIPQDDALEDLATAPWPPRPVSPARVSASRNAHSHPFDDPSNYLG